MMSTAINTGVIDHIAFATSDTEKSRAIFSILGFKDMLVSKGKIEKFASHITKLKSEYGQVLELVEPFSEKSVVNKILKNQSASIYHSAFFTPDLASTLAQLQAAGAVIVTEPMSIPYPATEAHQQYKTSHVFHSFVGLFEVTGFM